MYDVITIGSATRDAFFKVNYKTVRWPLAPSGKALMLPFGEKLGVEDAFFTIGGNAINASVTFSRQGLKTACVAKIGCDVSGEEIKSRLKAEGVNTRHLKCFKNLPTAYSTLLLKNGERTILGYHGASDSFSFRDIDFSKLKSRWWYISLAGESYRMYKRFIAFAKKNKIAVAFNPSGYHLRHDRQSILQSLNDLSFLVLNEGEAALLTGISFKKEKEVFKKLDKLMPGIIAVTDGPKGVTVSDGRFLYKAGVFPEKRIVDRTGAGDSFGSGFVASLVRKPRDIKQAIRLASANATSVVEPFGVSEGALTRSQFRNPRWKNLKIIIKQL